jgi:hypothetical protein
MRCSFQFNLGSNKTPKYFTMLVKAITCPSNLKGSMVSGSYISW